jgi:hypothetical protein
MFVVCNVLRHMQDTFVRRGGPMNTLLHKLFIICCMANPLSVLSMHSNTHALLAKTNQAAMVSKQQKLQHVQTPTENKLAIVRSKAFNRFALVHLNAAKDSYQKAIVALQRPFIRMYEQAVHMGRVVRYAGKDFFTRTQDSVLRILQRA